MLLGEEEIARIIKRAHPTAKVTELVSACVAACAALVVKRIRLVAPNQPSVNAKIVKDLKGRGLDVRSIVAFEESDDLKVGTIPTQSVVETAVTGDGGLSAEVDGVFISCTTLPSFAAVLEIERLTGKPTTSGNYALA